MRLPLTSDSPPTLLVMVLLSALVPGGLYWGLGVPVSVLRTPGDHIAEDLVRRGDRLLDAGNVQEAKGAFAAALRVDPDHAFALHGLGRVHRVLRQTARAAQLFQRVVDVDPEAARGITWLADTERELGHLERAASLFRRAVELEPWMGYHHRGLGWTYLAMGDLEQAIPCFKNALRFLPLGGHDYIKAFHGLSASCRGVRQTSFLQGTHGARYLGGILGDNSGSAFLAVAECTFHQGQFPRAARYYREAIEHEPFNGFAHKGAAWSALHAGDPERAKIHFERAFQLLTRSPIDRDDVARGLRAAARAARR